MFSYRELLNLDVRDQAHWAREAKIRKVEFQVELLKIIRLAVCGKKEDFEMFVDALENQIYELKGFKTTSVEETWEALRRQKRG